MKIKRKNLLLIIEQYLSEQDINYVEKVDDTLAFTDPKFDNLPYVSEEDIKKGIDLFGQIAEILSTCIRIFDEEIKKYIDIAKEPELLIQKIENVSPPKMIKLLNSQSKKVIEFTSTTAKLHKQFNSVLDFNKVLESEVRKCLASPNVNVQKFIRSALLEVNQIHKTYKNLLSETQRYANRFSSMTKDEEAGFLERHYLTFEFFLALLTVLEGASEIVIENSLEISSGDKVVAAYISALYLFLSSLNDLLAPIREYKKTARLIASALNVEKTYKREEEADKIGGIRPKLNVLDNL